MRASVFGSVLMGVCYAICATAVGAWTWGVVANFAYTGVGR